ncbi:phosphoadenosine phosphosulfate reductase [Pelagovum pacificum]|uniref:Phosphoadenosine phosphosulfate reductase n=1 Tax=Pelagovum pacificum TaxID=2588711 RepID=A0A5C5GG14_9RHOB|nr:phosphoadenosine phosphosulfate reductase [Pelagovum pacificum]QQA44398.1 phosphoadenosine phosphosulfate reductase [Pelagovum pacificum]TNY32486.1 phosphoadenosine phosphosulfate reductase [Pelagovum pacificum]
MAGQDLSRGVGAMVEETMEFDVDLSELSGKAWLDAVREAGWDFGFHEALGPAHDAVLIEGNRNLMVAFEVIPRVQEANPGREPRGWRLARSEGWTSLTLFSASETWFRNPAVYDFIDRMTDDGFFDSYDNVLFYGAGSGGYAAAAYSVAAPGAAVVALRPQATLTPDTTRWDRRFLPARRLEFESRYGFAPDMLDAARQAYVLFDPELTLDDMHAALFRRPNVLRLPCPHLGDELERALEGMHILDDVLRGAMLGTLDAAGFRSLYRARRRYMPYLRSLLTHTQQSGRIDLTERVCRWGIEHTNRPVFRNKLKALENRGDVTAAE